MDADSAFCSRFLGEMPKIRDSSVFPKEIDSG